MIELLIFLAIYLIIGFPILKEAVENIFHGELFDENFLMCVATIGAFIMGEYDEAVMVMVLYRVGEWLEDKAVDKNKDTYNTCRNDDCVEQTKRNFCDTNTAGRNWNHKNNC